jgi:hypothetical protein
LASKSAAALALALLLAMPARGELLRLSLLKKNMPAFTVKRDIFNGGSASAAAGQPGKQAPPAVQAAAVQKTIAEEIYQSVSYEGFVIKDGKRSALLNVSGEFFMVSEGDLVLEKITILKISRDVVTIEYESAPYEIRIKGDANG